MAQYRYSEAPFIITTNRTDLASCTEIHVTFEQGATQVDKTGEALTITEDGTTIITRMTQEEAATFTAGQAAKMQVTLLDPDGFRFVSNVVVGNVGESLIDSVIPVAAEGGGGLIMAAPITKLRIGLQPDTPEEHTRLLINVNTEAAQTSLQIATDLKVRANPATAKIYYYNYDGSELLYTETIEPGGNGSWDGEPGRASTAQYEYIFNGWSIEADQTDPTEGATAGVYSARRVYAAYKRRDISGFVVFKPMSGSVQTIRTYNQTKNWDGIIEYSTDGILWTEWDGKPITGDVTSGGAILLRGKGNSVISKNSSNSFVPGLGTEIHGNIEFLLDYEKALAGEAISFGDSCFSFLFQGASIISAPDLPTQTLTPSCYYSMFKGCTSLENAPELPAENLANNCYYSMFQGCTSLENAPELPAENLANSCYYSMFQGCTSLENAPELPAENLANSCYRSMFQGCTSLENAPELPAENLANSCYYSMFQGCTSLENAPEMHARTASSSSCRAMFLGCTALVRAPEILITTLASSCCKEMFKSCTSLVFPPEIMATSLPQECFSNAFYGCSAIKVSESKSEDYAIEYRIPQSGNGVVSGPNPMIDMFANTGGAFTGTPVINTIYYLAPPASA